jgi:hypothetical protein
MDFGMLFMSHSPISALICSPRRPFLLVPPIIMASLNFTIQLLFQLLLGWLNFFAVHHGSLCRALRKLSQVSFYISHRCWPYWLFGTM